MKTLFYTLGAWVAFVAGSTAYDVWGFCFLSVVGFVYCGGFIIGAFANLSKLLKKNGK